MLKLNGMGLTTSIICILNSKAALLRPLLRLQIFFFMMNKWNGWIWKTFVNGGHVNITWKLASDYNVKAFHSFTSFKDVNRFLLLASLLVLVLPFWFFINPQYWRMDLYSDDVYIETEPRDSLFIWHLVCDLPLPIFRRLKIRYEASVQGSIVRQSLCVCDMVYIWGLLRLFFHHSTIYIEMNVPDEISDACMPSSSLTFMAFQIKSGFFLWVGAYCLNICKNLFYTFFGNLHKVLLSICGRPTLHLQHLNFWG